MEFNITNWKISYLMIETYVLKSHDPCNGIKIFSSKKFLENINPTSHLF
jgi:hypothetical protein